MSTGSNPAASPGPLTAAVFHILVALSDDNLHGYGIMKAVKENTGPSFQMGPGTVYGCIQRMLDAGLVEDLGEAEDGRRRIYGITSAGREALAHESARIARMHEVIVARGLIPREARR